MQDSTESSPEIIIWHYFGEKCLGVDIHFVKEVLITLTVKEINPKFVYENHLKLKTMKKVLLSFGLVVCTIIGMQAQDTKVDAAATTIDNPNAPVMSFETEVMDYGTIEQGADGVREFVFTNTGKEPLIISNSRGSCGCTVPTWPKEPILPGEKSVIKVKYDTKRLGAINKSVTITSNATEATKVIRIKGNIIAPKTTPVKENATGAPVAN